MSGFVPVLALFTGAVGGGVASYGLSKLLGGSGRRRARPIATGSAVKVARMRSTRPRSRLGPNTNAGRRGSLTSRINTNGPSTAPTPIALSSSR